MARYPRLGASLKADLLKIQPAIRLGVAYYPASVRTDTGESLTCVYLVEENGYFRQWGVWPEMDAAKRAVDINRVASIAESPKRLPWRYAKKIYDSGESGMGYHIFTISFENGAKQVVTSGGAVDFVEFPNGLRGDNITDVILHVNRGSPSTSVPDYYWSLYSE